MGLRQRILTLPVMVAFVLSLIWRQVGSVTEAVRELSKRGFSGRPDRGQPTSRFGATGVFPPELFRQV